jgi:hypothetical protein
MGSIDLDTFFNIGSGGLAVFCATKRKILLSHKGQGEGFSYIR